MSHKSPSGGTGIAPAQEERSKPYVPAKQLDAKYPLIDNDPHFSRVVRYARPSDVGWGVALSGLGPALLWAMEKVAPSGVGKGGFAPVMRLTGAIGLGGGFIFFYQSSIHRFYGLTENRREVEMDMREMVDKVKKGEPLYGRSSLSEHMQGVAARNSRYSGLFLYAVPWFNFVNHPYHGVDTAKYYRQAERELAADEATKGKST